MSAIVPAPGPVASLVAEAVGVAPDAPVAAPAAPVIGQPRLYQVQANDSLWRLAGQDDAMLKRILELNEDQIRTPVDLRPGMILRLPEGADVPQGAPSPPGSAVQPAAGPRERVVERGDNLWELTEAQLVAAGTPDPSNAQIVDQLGRVIELNTPPIVDPDLIYPGQVVLLPPVGSATVAPLPPPAGPADTDPALPSGADLGGVPSGADLGAVPSGADLGAVPSGADLGAVSAGAVLAQIDPAPAAAAPPATASGDLTAADPTALRGVEIMGVAAAAMLGLVERRRRRHRAAFGFAPAGAGPDGGTFLDELAAAADPGLTLWAAAELYPLLQVAAGIATVGLSSVDGLEVTWTAEPEVTIDGWTVVEPRRWRSALRRPGGGGGRSPPGGPPRPGDPGRAALPIRPGRVGPRCWPTWEPWDR